MIGIKRIIINLICVLLSLCIMTPLFSVSASAMGTADSFNKQAADELRAGLDECLDEIAFSKAISDSDLFSVYQRVFDEAPYCYYVYNISDIVTDSSGRIKKISVKYLFDDADSCKKAVKECEDEVNTIISGIDSTWTDFQKCAYLHDYLVLSCKYDYQEGRRCRSVYGALIEKNIVCVGYARAYRLLLSRVGVTAENVTSNAMNHMWNIVNVDGNWYHVDITYDDGYTIFSSDGATGHKYFLKSDIGLKDHSKDWTLSDVTIDEGSSVFYYPDAPRALSKKYDKELWSNSDRVFAYADNCILFSTKFGDICCYDALNDTTSLMGAISRKGRFYSMLNSEKNIGRSGSCFILCASANGDVLCYSSHYSIKAYSVKTGMCRTLARLPEDSSSKEFIRAVCKNKVLRRVYLGSAI
ncbi:MAG: hypothetical protein II773_10670 [Oscillospiraceae bacterium]|nr:hypothetical protein [Oscillospiraceae bacterium]